MTGSSIKFNILESQATSYLKLIESFLSNRFQQKVLNGQSSSQATVCAGVPRFQFRTPFLSIYTNDLSKNISSTAKLYANDTPSIQISAQKPSAK